MRLTPRAWRARKEEVFRASRRRVVPPRYVARTQGGVVTGAVGHLLGPPPRYVARPQGGGGRSLGCSAKALSTRKGSHRPQDGRGHLRRGPSPAYVLDMKEACAPKGTGARQLKRMRTACHSLGTCPAGEIRGGHRSPEAPLSSAHAPREERTQAMEDADRGNPCPGHGACRENQERRWGRGRHRLLRPPRQATA